MPPKKKSGDGDGSVDRRDSHHVLRELRESVDQATLAIQYVARAQSAIEMKEAMVPLISCFNKSRAALARFDTIMMNELGELPAGRSGIDRAMAIAVEQSEISMSDLEELAKTSRRKAEISKVKERFKKG